MSEREKRWRPPAPKITIRPHGIQSFATDDERIAARIQSEIGTTEDLARRIADIVREERGEAGDHVILTSLVVVSLRAATENGIAGYFLPIQGTPRLVFRGEVIS